VPTGRAVRAGAALAAADTGAGQPPRLVLVGAAPDVPIVGTSVAVGTIPITATLGPFVWKLARPGLRGLAREARAALGARAVEAAVPRAPVVGRAARRRPLARLGVVIPEVRGAAGLDSTARATDRLAPTGRAGRTGADWLAARTGSDRPPRFVLVGAAPARPIVGTGLVDTILITTRLGPGRRYDRYYDLAKISIV